MLQAVAGFGGFQSTRLVTESRPKIQIQSADRNRFDLLRRCQTTRPRESTMLPSFFSFMICGVQMELRIPRHRILEIMEIGLLGIST